MTPLGRVDVQAAEAVEDAWKELPFVAKIVLKEWFVMRERMHRICKRLRTKRFPVYEKDWPLEIERAKRLLADELALQKKTVYNAADAVIRAPLVPMGGIGALEIVRQAA